MPSIKYTQTLQLGNLTIGGAPVTLTSGGAMMLLDITVAPEATNQPYTLPVVVSSNTAHMIVSDLSGVIVSTNDTHGGSPDDDFTLTKDLALFWSTDMPDSMKVFTADIDTIYFNNPDGAKTAHIKLAIDANLFSD